MKIRSLTIVCLLAVLAVVHAGLIHPEVPGPVIIRECPHCGAQLRQYTTMSGNTFGAMFWTDGYMFAPMLPDHPWLVKCPACGGFVWISEAEELGEREAWGSAEQWPAAVDTEVPSEAEFLELLAAGGLSPDQQMYLRQRAWWAANDLARWNPDTSYAFSDAQKENLRVLADTLDEVEPEQRIVKAEILRELGRFEECIALLERPFDDATHAQYAEFIIDLARRRIRAVREIER